MYEIRRDIIANGAPKGSIEDEIRAAREAKKGTARFEGSSGNEIHQEEKKVDGTINRNTTKGRKSLPG